MYTNNKKYIHLITGGAGFIGSNLTNYLLKNNQKVICIDDFTSGSITNIQRWINNPDFTFIEDDITKDIDIKSDKIWHLACPASPQKYNLNQLKTLKTGFIGTLNMLNLAKKYNSKFLLTSSSEIYGKNYQQPQRENNISSDSPFNQRSCYIESKRISETLCFQYKNYVDLKVARIFNTYGPNMLENDGRVISNFISKALNNNHLTIYGSGNQTRSFCYIDDLIIGLIKLMNSDYDSPINLGNNKEITIKDLANIVIKKTKNTKNILFKKAIENEPLRRCPEIKNALNELNWQPKIDLDTGLNLTIEFYKKIFSKNYE